MLGHEGMEGKPDRRGPDHVLVKMGCLLSTTIGYNDTTSLNQQVPASVVSALLLIGTCQAFPVECLSKNLLSTFNPWPQTPVWKPERPNTQSPKPQTFSQRYPWLYANDRAGLIHRLGCAPARVRLCVRGSVVATRYKAWWRVDMPKQDVCKLLGHAKDLVLTLSPRVGFAK